MVKPLHAGLAARNGIVAAQLAGAGMTASGAAIDGPQGFLAAFASEQPSLDAVASDLGTRWEIVDTGITVKLYPSCAGTHPALDALLDLQRRERFDAGEVEAIEVGVDAIVPKRLLRTLLLWNAPRLTRLVTLKISQRAWIRELPCSLNSLSRFMSSWISPGRRPLFLPHEPSVPLAGVA